MEFKVNIDRVIRQFTELVSIDALSLGERQMADALITELENLGFEVTEDKAGEVYGSDTGNIYAILRGTDPEAEPLLLSAHMDTVVPGTGKKAVIDRDKGLITSAGDTVLGADDVSGIAEILEGVRLVKENSIRHGDIEVLFTIAEEVYAKGAKVFAYDRIRSRTAFIADMSGSVGSAAKSAPSIITFDFDIQGKPAHAGFDPRAGINAVAIAADIISGTRQGLLEDGLTLNIGTIEGGKVSNIVPDNCRCTGEVRGSNHEAALRVVNDLEQSVRAACSAAGAACIFNSNIMIQAYETPLTDKSCEVFRKACSNLGLEGRLVATRGGSDNNIFARHGIGGIVVATGMGNTHSTSEFINIRDLEAGSRLIAEIIALSAE